MERAKTLTPERMGSAMLSRRSGALAGIALAVLWAPMALVIPFFPNLAGPTGIGVFYADHANSMKWILASISVGSSDSGATIATRQACFSGVPSRTSCAAVISSRVPGMPRRSICSVTSPARRAAVLLRAADTFSASLR